MERNIVAENAIKTTLRRVAKDSYHNIDRGGYARCMECWQLYMQINDLKLSASKSNLSGGEQEDAPIGYEDDIYAKIFDTDLNIGRATNAMIDSLPQAAFYAIYKKYGQTTQWRFPNIDLLTFLPQVEEELEKKLRKNIATMDLFC